MNREIFSKVMKQWRCPATDELKVNFDAVVDEAKQKVGIGVIIRDWQGQIMASTCFQKNSMNQPVIAESMALWKVVEFCFDLGLKKLFFIEMF